MQPTKDSGGTTACDPSAELAFTEAFFANVHRYQAANGHEVASSERHGIAFDLLCFGLPGGPVEMHDEAAGVDFVMELGQRRREREHWQYA
jgi:hypothetical protein